MKRPELPDIRAAAAGRWPDILAAVGVPETYLNTRQHQPCPACGGRDRFRFTDFQDNGGFICNQCAPDGGSGFDLIMLVLGCEFTHAVDLVAAQLGMSAEKPSLPPKLPPKPQTPQTYPNLRTDQIKRIKGFLWGARPITRHSPAGCYLQQRGLSWGAIADGLRGLYWRESLDYWAMDSYGRPFKLGAFPAMVAKITRPTANGGELMGVHLTYLHNDHGKWRKADITDPVTGKPLPAKKMQSRCQGALTGATVALYPPQDGVIVVAEGIETALAARQLFDLPVWACLSAHGMSSMIPPPRLQTLYIVADNDSNNTGQAAARALSNRAIKGGVTVNRWQPPTMGHDALDELNRQQNTTQETSL